MGDTGSGKTTLLKEIANSLQGKEFFDKKGYSRFTDWNTSGNRMLVTDWKRDLGEWTLRKFLTTGYFDTDYFKSSQQTNEKIMIDRVKRNSNLGNAKEVEAIAQKLSEEYAVPLAETLNRMTFIVECGIYLSSQPIPESMYTNLEIELVGKKVGKIEILRPPVDKPFSQIEYRDFPKVQLEGMSKGESVKQAVTNLVEEYKGKENVILLLDEPTSSLSRTGIDFVIEKLQELPGQEFVATHSERLINALTDRDARTINMYTSPTLVESDHRV